MTNETPNSRADSIAIQEAQKALRLFWDEAYQKYGEQSSLDLKNEERQRLAEIERRLLEALKSFAEKHSRT